MGRMQQLKEWRKTNDIDAVAIGVIAVSFVVYCYYFILEPFNSDTYCVGLLKYSAETAGVQLGCWSSLYYYKLTGMIVNPVFSHIIYTVCIIASTIMINDLWGIKHRVIRVLTGASLMVAPSVVGQLMYIYVYPTFGLAFLCCVGSVYLFFSVGKPMGVIAAIVFMATSLGFYSIYLGPLLFLGIGTLILRLIGRNYNSFREFMITLAKSIGFILAGLILFYGMMELHFVLYHTVRSSYAGGGDVGIGNTLMNIPTYFKSTYRQFAGYYRDAKLCGNLFWGVLMLSALICTIYQMVRMIKKREYWMAAGLLALAAAIPPCANIMLFIMPQHGLQLHWLYQLQIMAPFCAAIIGVTSEELPDDAGRDRMIKVCAMWLTAITMSGLVISYAYRAYCSFRTVDVGNRHIKLYIQNAITHAIEDDLYEEGMPIVFMGFVNDDPIQEQNPLLKYSYYERAYPFWKDRYEVFSTWPKYCWYNYGIDIGQVTAEQYDNILKSDEFKNMEQYPSSKAYAVIDGCYVILLDRESVR